MPGQHIKQGAWGSRNKTYPPPQSRTAILLCITEVPGGILGQKRANIKQFPDFLSKSSKMLVYIEVGHRIYLSDQFRFTTDTRLSHYMTIDQL